MSPPSIKKSKEENSKESKKEMYERILKEAESLIQGEPDCFSNLANVSSLIFYALNDRFDRIHCNWCGFYILKNNLANTAKELVLSAFQGRVACLRIPIGKGVCGTAVQQQKTQLVPNVHLFPHHIACDSASESEIVIPIFHENQVIGVLDLDALDLNFFTEEDSEGLTQIVKLLEKSLNWSQVSQ